MNDFDFRKIMQPAEERDATALRAEIYCHHRFSFGFEGHRWLQMLSMHKLRTEVLLSAERPQASRRPPELDGQWCNAIAGQQGTESPRHSPADQSADE